MNSGGRGRPCTPAFRFHNDAEGAEVGDYEWTNPELTTSAVRDQKGQSCVFNAIAHSMESQKKGVVIDVDSYFKEYTEHTIVPFGQDLNRVITALKMLKDKGVIATCNGNSEMRLHISGHKCYRGMDENQVFSMIDSGIPLLGSFPVRDDFDDLKSGIYELNPPPKHGDPLLDTHIVLFVGHGKRMGRPYLVFKNSYGTDWGTSGLGRVYFDQVLQEDDEGFQLIRIKQSCVFNAIAHSVESQKKGVVIDVDSYSCILLEIRVYID